MIVALEDCAFASCWRTAVWARQLSENSARAGRSAAFVFPESSARSREAKPYRPALRRASSTALGGVIPRPRTKS